MDILLKKRPLYFKAFELLQLGQPKIEGSFFQRSQETLLLPVNN
jgi:hypothetical protein